MNRFLLLLATDFHTLDAYIWEVGAGALILDRCRAFDLFASVDAHLWRQGLLFFGLVWFYPENNQLIKTFLSSLQSELAL
jgi:hypothetical protein